MTTSPDAATIIRLYDTEKKSMLAVSRETGADYKTVDAIVTQAGVKREYFISPQRQAAIIEACTAGMTQRQAAARFRVGREAVARIVRGAAPPPRLPGRLIPAAEAAGLLGISADEMSVLARAGAVRAERRTPHGHRRYAAADVEALAAMRTAAEGTPDLAAGRALDALRWCWGDVYEIWIEQDTGLWLARRLDGMGVIEGDSPEKLNAAIREDWLLRPGGEGQ